MNCQEARSFVEDALDRSLSGRVKRRLDLHLQHCKECRDFFEAERVEFVRWYRAVNCDCGHSHSLPTDFADRLVAAVTAPRSLPFFLRMPRWALVAASVAIMFMGVAFAGVVVERVILSAKEEAATGDVPECEASQETLVADTGTGDSYVPQNSFFEEFAQSEQLDIAEAISTTKTETSNNTPSASTQENGENAKMNIRKTTTALAAAFALVTGSAQAADDWTVSENFTLTEDMSVGALTVNSGVTLDLAGHKLTCSSLDGSGTITSTEADLTTPSGTCTKVSPSQAYNKTVVDNLFNDNTTYRTDEYSRLALRTSQANQKLPLRVDYDFGDGNAKVVDKYTIYTGASGRAPKAWTLYGSNSAYGSADEDGWTKIDERTSETGWTNKSSGNAADLRTYICANDTAYRYYRLKVTDHNGNEYFEIVQLEYFKSGELHLNVESGSATWPASITFTGNIKVVKEGEGVLTSSANLDMNDGLFVIAAGTVSSSGNFRLAQTGGKNVEVLVNDGGTLHSGGVLAIGCGGRTARLTVNGGSVYSVDNMRVGNSTSSAATLTINGGTVQVPSQKIVTFQDGPGTVNLNGGMLKAPRITKGTTGAGTLNFNGGTLQAQSGNPSSPYFVAGTLSAVNVLAGGGTIDANGNVAQIGMPLLGEGAMTFKGGSTITLAAANTYTGGTTIELGTTVNASDATAKDTILSNLVIDGRAVLEGKTYDVLVASDLTASDLENVKLENCAAAATVGFDNGETPTKIVVTLAEPTVVNTTTPIMAFPGVALSDIKYADFTSRMFGKYANDYNALNSAKGCNKKFYYDDGGSVTNIVVEFQASDGANIRCVVVEFMDGEDGVYATAVGARYQSNTSLGFLFLEQDKTTWHGAYKSVATSRAESDYGVCDFRYTMGETPDAEWTLDEDKTWSVLRNGATLASDDVVRITVVNADAVLTVDEDVNVGQIEFVNGSGATLKIAESMTLTAEDISGIRFVHNDGTFVKTGAGMITLPFDRDYAATGVTIVSNGTLMVSKTGTGNNCHSVRVASGATFDINGNSVSFAVTLEDGAHFVNNGTDIPNNYQQANSITLEGNATVLANNGHFGFLAPDIDPTYLNLGLHTLTINGSSAKEFMLCNTTIIGDGTIYVASGRFCTRSKDSTGEDCTISIGASGFFENNKHLTVKNFVNNGTISFQNKSDGWGRGELEVTGEFTSKTASFPKLTLTGATVKAATGAVVTVLDAFNTSGTITIDASEITKAQLEEAEDERIPVLTVPTDDAGGFWAVTNPPAAGIRAKWVNNGNGTSTLYLCKSQGTVFIIR